MSGRLRVREIDDDEGQQLARIVRRGSGPVVTWRRAQMVLLSAQGMDVPAIAKVAFTSEHRVGDVIGNFNADGFSSLYPKYRGGHPPKFTLGACSPPTNRARTSCPGTSSRARPGPGSWNSAATRAPCIRLQFALRSPATTSAPT